MECSYSTPRLCHAPLPASLLLLLPSPVRGACFSLANYVCYPFAHFACHNNSHVARPGRQAATSPFPFPLPFLVLSPLPPPPSFTFVVPLPFPFPSLSRCKCIHFQHFLCASINFQHFSLLPESEREPERGQQRGRERNGEWRMGEKQNKESIITKSIEQNLPT